VVSCCGYRLRPEPRSLKYKAKLKARKEIAEAKILLHVQPTINLREVG
jgi:hypothetical protein